MSIAKLLRPALLSIFGIGCCRSRIGVGLGWDWMEEALTARSLAQNLADNANYLQVCAPLGRASLFAEKRRD